MKDESVLRCSINGQRYLGLNAAASLMLKSKNKSKRLFDFSLLRILLFQRVTHA